MEAFLYFCIYLPITSFFLYVSMYVCMYVCMYIYLVFLYIFVSLVCPLSVGMIYFEMYSCLKWGYNSSPRSPSICNPQPLW